MRLSSCDRVHRAAIAQPRHLARRSFRIVVNNAVVGIDLGTTNSAIAAVEEGVSTVLKNAAGRSSVPSFIAIAQDGTVLVGQDAISPPAGYSTFFSSNGLDEAQERGAGWIPPSDCFHSFKRLLGKKYEEVEEEAARLGYSVGEGDRGEAAVYSPAMDDMLSPAELSSWLLRHLRQQAEAALGEAVTGAVVTVPACCSQAQLGATHAAAQLAGLAPVQLLQEPVAAALAYGISGGTDGDTVLVFDVGGGTFDVSILQAFEGIMEVLGTAGDARLGGDDLDASLAGWLMEQCAESAAERAAAAATHDWGTGEASSSSDSRGGGSHVAAGSEQQMAPSKLRRWAMAAARDAKVALSSSDVADVVLPGGGRLQLTRQQFEEVTVPLFQRMANVLEALGEALFVEWAVAPSAAVPGRAAEAETMEPCSSQHQDLLVSASSGSSSGSSSSALLDRQLAQQPQQRQRHQVGTSTADRWAPPPRRITQVALVGQVTRLPSLQRFVREITGVEPCMSVDPAEAVALGAAIHAGVLLGQVSGVELMDGSYSAELHDRATGFTGWQP